MLLVVLTDQFKPLIDYFVYTLGGQPDTMAETNNQQVTQQSTGVR